MTTPTTEPASQRAGDSWAWRREDLSTDYPATEWTLAYAFKNATLGFEIAATASGLYFAVAVAGDVTAAYTAGRFSWQARVTNIAVSTAKHTVDEGTLQILPSFFTVSAATALDARSFARKRLDTIETAIAALETGVKAYTIGSRQMTYRDMPELESLRDRYRLAVAREDQKEGRPNNIGRTHYARFGRAA